MIVTKPWGYEDIWAHTDEYVGKILYIKNNQRLSLQYHEKKKETVRVLKGTLTLVMENHTYFLDEGESKHIPSGTIHRMEARDGDVMVIEVSTPELDDVVRLQDDYQRR